MNLRKMAVIGVLALFAAAAGHSDAQAFGKRKRQQQNNCCPQPVQQSCCGGGGYAGAMPAGTMPLAMPMPGTGAVVPASGTQPQSGTTVVPAGGTIPNTGNVIPAGQTYYYPNGSTYPTTSYYYNPATNSYYPMTSSGYTTPQRRGLFRRY